MSARTIGPSGMHNSAALREARALFMSDRSAAVPAAAIQNTTKAPEYPNSPNTQHTTRLPFFRTDDRITHLLYRAEQWRGTPWCANSDARRAGVSCHNLPRAIYIECGALLETFPRVKGDPNGSRHTKVSVMTPFLDARPEFQRLDLSRDPAAELQPGDLLGLRIYHCCDHLGVFLGNGAFVHVLCHKHTDFDVIFTPPWQQRLVAAWRPLDLPRTLEPDSP